MKEIRTVFVGTSEEGVSTLEALDDSELYDVTAVITQPDRPVGKKREMTATPIKLVAQNREIPVYSPESAESDDYKTVLDTHKPELIIVISFGQFLPSFFIEFPEYRCLNVHYSLLPLLRGAVPVQKAILEGHSETGVTVQIMEEKMDTGPVLAQKAIEIAAGDTTPSLKEKLVPAGRDLLMETLPKWISGKIEPQEQNETKATYCYMDDISKKNAEIVWDKMEAKQIDRMVRALLPWPVAWTILPNGKRLKIYSAQMVNREHDQASGKILSDTESLYFATLDPGKVLEVVEGQQEGKKRMSGRDLRQGISL